MRLAALFAAALLAACSTTEARTQVMVVVDAEPGMRDATRSLRVELFGGARDTELDKQEEHVVPGSAIEWPILVAVAPSAFNTNRRFRIEVFAIGEDDEEIGAVRAQTGFVEGRTLSLPLLFEDACRGELCSEATTCERGSCVFATQEPEELDDFEREGEPEDDAGMDAADDAADDASREDVGPADARPDASDAADASDDAADGNVMDAGDAADASDSSDASDAADTADTADTAMPCVPATELCNSNDDDCDGVIDEGFVDIDPANCRTCGGMCSGSQVCSDRCGSMQRQRFMYLGGTGISSITSIAALSDTDGDVTRYCFAGTYNDGSLTIGSWTAPEDAPSGAFRAFVACCTTPACATPAMAFAYTSDQATISGLALAPDGAMFVSGSTGYASFTLGGDTADTAAFIARYEPTGTLGWHHFISGQAGHGPPSITVTRAGVGHVLVGGQGTGRLSVGSTPIGGFNDGALNAFVALFEPDMATMARAFSTSASGDELLTGIDASGDSDRIFFGVEYSDNLELDTITRSDGPAFAAFDYDIPTMEIVGDFPANGKPRSFYGIHRLESFGTRTSASSTHTATMYARNIADELVPTTPVVVTRTSGVTFTPGPGFDDIRGSLLLSGVFSGSVSVGPAPVALSSSATVAYYANVDRAGRLRWARNTSMADFMEINALGQVDRQGFLLAGQCGGWVRVGGEAMEMCGTRRAGFVFLVTE